jgi:hypothetical protein
MNSTHNERSSQKIKNVIKHLRLKDIVFVTLNPMMKHDDMLKQAKNKVGFINYSASAYQQWKRISRTTSNPFLVCEYITSQEVMNNLTLNEQRVARYTMQRQIREAFLIYGLNTEFGPDPASLNFKIMVSYNY